MKAPKSEALSDFTYYLASKVGIKTVDNFELFLVFASFITLVIWIIFRKYNSSFSGDGLIDRIFQGSRTWFLLFLTILIVRSSFIEPYNIYESDLEPEIQSYSHIIIDKISWGIRLPLTNRIISFRSPQRGEIVMANYQDEEYKLNTKRIGRVIGLAGDKIVIDYAKLTASVTKDNGDIFSYQFKGHPGKQSKIVTIIIPRDRLLLVTDSFYTEQFDDPHITELDNIIGSPFYNIGSISKLLFSSD